MQTKVWHMSVVLQSRKQPSDFHLAFHPTYYTEFYSNYEPNEVLLTPPFSTFFKKASSFHTDCTHSGYTIKIFRAGLKPNF